MQTDNLPTTKYGIHYNPPVYTSADQMAVAIDLYFKDCFQELKDANNEVTIKLLKAPTLAGLSLALGFADRQSLYDYEKRNKGHEAYACVLKRARTFIEDFIESGMITGRLAAVPSIFTLKNHHGWVDKQEIEVKPFDYSGEYQKAQERDEEIRRLKAEVGLKGHTLGDGQAGKG